MWELSLESLFREAQPTAHPLQASVQRCTAWFAQDLGICSVCPPDNDDRQAICQQPVAVLGVPI